VNSGRDSAARYTIQVGRSFQASVQLLSCGGKQHLVDVIRGMLTIQRWQPWTDRRAESSGKVRERHGYLQVANATVPSVACKSRLKLRRHNTAERCLTRA